MSSKPRITKQRAFDIIFLTTLTAVMAFLVTQSVLATINGRLMEPADMAIPFMLSVAFLLLLVVKCLEVLSIAIAGRSQ